MAEAKMMYWGVQCPVCSEIIGLAAVNFDTDGRAIPPSPSPDPFEAECHSGHIRGIFSKSQVVMFEGPLALGFQTHPAFR